MELLSSPSEKEKYLNVLLHLRLMLAGQLFVLPLELCDEDLPLDLLLLLQGQELLLQLLLAHCSTGHTAAPAASLTRLLAGRRELLLLLMVHTQVHGDGGWWETQRQR